MNYDARLDRLEQSNRRLKLAAALGIVLLLLLCGVALMTASYADSEEISAQRIVLRDKQGQPRCTLETNEEGEVVQTMSDADGTARIKMLIDSEGTARLRLYDERNEHVRSAMYAFRTDHENNPSIAGLATYSSTGEFGCDIQNANALVKMTMIGQKKLRHMTYADAEGFAGSVQYDIDGKVLLQSFTGKDAGNASIQILDNQQQARWSTNVFDSGLANSRQINKEGKPWSVSYSHENGAGQAFYFDDEAKAALLINREGQLSTIMPADAAETIIESLGLSKTIIDTLRLLAEG